MGFAEGFKAFLEIGMLGLCSVMMCVIFYENHKRNKGPGPVQRPSNNPN